MERPWAGAENGTGEGVLLTQEVELEAEAEAVVVLGPRSVLLPSMGKEEMMMFLLGRDRGGRGDVLCVH